MYSYDYIYYIVESYIKKMKEHVGISKPKKHSNKIAMISQQQNST